VANTVFKLGVQALISGGINLSTDTIKVALVRGYTPNATTHQFLSDVTGGGGGTIVATSVALSTVSVALGVFSAANVTFTSVAAGAAAAYLVLYKDTGVAGTSPLIAWIDTATGLPVTPDGGNIQITWDTGANKIINWSV
jgi:hypothetical protein